MNRITQAFKVLVGRSSRDVDMSGANSLFGTIGAKAIPVPTNAEFIPTDGDGGIMDLTGSGISPVWLGLDNHSMQFWAYNYCSPLAAVIDRLAEADSNGIIEFVDDYGARIKNFRKNPKLLRIMRLLKRPNPLQTWFEFNAQQTVIAKIFGYCPVLAVSPVGMDKSFSSSLWNLDPMKVVPERNYQFDMYGTESNVIKKWRYSYLGTMYEFDPGDILLIKDGFINASTSELPMSKIAGLDFWVSNICAALEADNVLLKKKGPLGVFSHDPKPDMAGWLPMKEVEKSEIQNDLSKYGLTIGQLQYVISKTPLKWNAMSFNLRDLMTKENVREGIDGICDRFGYPAELMSGKNATYENRRSSEKFLYQNNIVPYATRKMARYNDFFGLEESILSLDYNHLAVMQEDILQAGQAYKARTEGLDVAWKGNLITWNEWRIEQGMDSEAGMDIYYHQYAKQFGIEEKKTAFGPEGNPQENNQ